MNTEQFPTTLHEAIIFFADADNALEFVKTLRWPDGVTCPRCGCQDVYFISTRRIWKCKQDRKTFSVKFGTIFEDSPLGLDKWLAAIWLIANAKNGISSYEIHRALGITQKSAWFVLHRIRLAMRVGSFEKKLIGDVEVDESYIGGKARNMHKARRETRPDKSIVVGLLERKGEVRTKVVKNVTKETLEKTIGQHVEFGSKVYTDEFPSYADLEPDYKHLVINHAERYVKGNIHTNGIENYWSLFDRTMTGTYTHCEPFHLFRYLDEQTFRFNTRKGNDAMRFMSVVSRISGKRLTYAKLTNNEGKKPLRQLRLI